jgi:phenylacetic acid degradation operon negative regulatory protein
VNARSALFDLYGDHLRPRGGRAPVAALVRMLAPLEVAPPAVRTAVSRMVAQGWLAPERLPGGPGYALTPRAVRRLDEAAARIYRTHAGWDGQWHLVVTPRLPRRAARERLRAGMGFLGYAPIDDSTWLGPRDSPEVDALLGTQGAAAECFTARHVGESRRLVARAWDLDELAAAYEAWIIDAERLVLESGPAPSDEEAFALRSRLVHEWRKFLFRDPGLPAELLPPGWPGARAAALFDAEATRLAPAAARFVEGCLPPAPEPAPGPAHEQEDNHRA